MDTTGTKDFVLYSEVSLAHGEVADIAPLFICGQLMMMGWAMDNEKIVLIIDLKPLDKNQGHVWALLQL